MQIVYSVKHQPTLIKMEEEAIYSFGQCNICKEINALRNGVCGECKAKQKDTENLPDFFKDIFKGF